MDEDEAMRRLAALPGLVNGDTRLVHRGRFVTLDFGLDVGAGVAILSVERGRIAALETSQRPMRSWRFAVRGEARGWLRFWQRVPAPHDHDIFALAKRGALRIEGDLYPLMANLLYFKEVLAAPRRIAVEQAR